MRLQVLAVLVGTVMALAGGADRKGNATAPRFYRDDPIWQDDDRRPIPPPQPVPELSQVYDFVENTFLDPGAKGPQAAANINTVGEVPDSSWFTNRHGRRLMSAEELVRGPLQHERAPDESRPWKIIKAKTEGVTPGFWIRDGRGDVYNVKFDPKTNPEMATGAEAVVTRFFHALGYFVPENYLTVFDPAALEVADSAVLTDDDGKKRKMQRADIEEILNRVPRLPDGRVRALASRFLAGKPLGPFRYYGTRSDDPNDIFPHENRRELRGLRVFAAWLNHDDSRSVNTQDMFREPERYVVHNLLDFGSTLGSGSVRQQTRRAGNEYMLEWETILKKAVSLGIYDRPWQFVRYPALPAVGRFESSFFRPEKWRPEYPNPAFVRMDDDDAFWAARTVMRFSDDQIEALVQTGQYSDPKVAAYLTQCLVERRDKIGRYYFGRVNPLVEFEISGDQLQFENLAVRYKFSKAPAAYRYRWARYNNDTGVESEQIGWSSAPTPSADIPEQVRSGRGYYKLEITASDEAETNFGQPASVYVRNTPGGLEVVGIVR